MFSIDVENYDSCVFNAKILKQTGTYAISLSMAKIGNFGHKRPSFNQKRQNFSNPGYALSKMVQTV